MHPPEWFGSGSLADWEASHKESDVAAVKVIDKVVDQERLELVEADETGVLEAGLAKFYGRTARTLPGKVAQARGLDRSYWIRLLTRGDGARASRLSVLAPDTGQADIALLRIHDIETLEGIWLTSPYTLANILKRTPATIMKWNLQEQAEDMLKQLDFELWQKISKNIEDGADSGMLNRAQAFSKLAS